jgi:hypothetical protein
MPNQRTPDFYWGLAYWAIGSVILLLGKTPLTKKAHEKSLTSIEQSLMAGPNCQAGRGKDGAAMNLGLVWVLYKRKVKEVNARAVVSGRGGAV